MIFKMRFAFIYDIHYYDNEISFINKKFFKIL